MAEIMKRHFSGGGQQLDSLYAGGGKATLQKILEDIATDLAAIKIAEVATADAAVTAVADATDLPTALTLVNDLKAKYNAAVALINALKSAANTVDGETLLTTIQA